MALGGFIWRMYDAMMRLELKVLERENESLRRRLEELEVRWEREITGGLGVEIAELRGTVKGLKAGQSSLIDLIEQLLRKLPR